MEYHLPLQWFLFLSVRDILVLYTLEGRGGSMSQVVGLPNNSYKPITNMAWVCARLCKLQKRVHSTSDKVYQLLAHGRWFSPCTPSSSTTKTGRHDIAKILLKVTFNTINQINVYPCTRQVTVSRKITVSFQTFLHYYIHLIVVFSLITIYVGGRFGRRSRLVAAHFTLWKSSCNFTKSLC